METSLPPPLHAALFQDDPARDAQPAVVWATGSLTHGQLRRDARRLAGLLARMGLGRGDRVALWLPKCVEAVQAIAGILGAGAAYVPIDALLPLARVRRLLADAQPGLVVTTMELATKLLVPVKPGTGADATTGTTAHTGTEAGSPGAPLPQMLILDEIATGAGLDPWLAGTPTIDPAVPASVTARDLAAMLYTSGSSGEPKAVMLSHGAVASFVRWAIGSCGLRAGDRFTSHAPFHFDLSMLDLFAPLQLGASVLLLDEKTVLFPAAVVRAIARHGCTIWYSVPTALRQMLERGGLAACPLPALRWVIFAGEVFPLRSLRELMRALPAPRYANWYGPTETNVCTYHHFTEPPDDNATSLPIGLACEHLEVRILGDDDRPVAAGETGEICVFGPAVMAGYWWRPELTAATRIGGRADSYRTGDLGCIGPDGAIRFLGRRDQQVKIRGHRFELLEIEAVLATHPQVAQAAAVFSAAENTDGRLVAFVVPAAGTTTDAAALHRHCAAQLPAYAVPAEFVTLAQLPATSRGKLDRARLTALARSANDPAAGVVPPSASP